MIRTKYRIRLVAVVTTIRFTTHFELRIMIWRIMDHVWSFVIVCHYLLLHLDNAVRELFFPQITIITDSVSWDKCQRKTMWETVQYALDINDSSHNELHFRLSLASATTTTTASAPSLTSASSDISKNPSEKNRKNNTQSRVSPQIRVIYFFILDMDIRRNSTMYLDPCPLPWGPQRDCGTSETNNVLDPWCKQRYCIRTVDSKWDSGN